MAGAPSTSIPEAPALRKSCLRVIRERPKRRKSLAVSVGKGPHTTRRLVDSLKRHDSKVCPEHSSWFLDTLQEPGLSPREGNASAPFDRTIANELGAPQTSNQLIPSIYKNNFNSQCIEKQRDAFKAAAGVYSDGCGHDSNFNVDGC